MSTTVTQTAPTVPIAIPLIGARATSDVVPLTGDIRIDALTQGSAWLLGPDRVITYSLDLNFDGPTQVWTQPWIDAIASAFSAWEVVANVRFVMVGTPNAQTQNQGTGDIALGLDPSPGSNFAALGIFPDPKLVDQLLVAAGYMRTSGPFPYPRLEGDISFNSAAAVFGDLNVGGGGFEILVHEIGHALGLKHPEDDGGNARPTTTAYIGSETIMINRVGLDSIHSRTPMPLDILAIQNIYGANTNYHAGNDTHVISPGYYTIWDAGGIDTIEITSAGYIDLREGNAQKIPYQSPNGAAHIAYGAVIENAKGSPSNDQIIGNDVDNILDGGAGSDLLQGLLGNDTYMVDDVNDSVIEGINEGIDTVRTSVSGYVLPQNVENLVLLSGSSASGNSLDNILTGNEFPNTLYGREGNDFLDGGGGDDTLLGGPGNDTYVINGLGNFGTFLYLNRAIANNLPYYVSPATGTFTLEASDYGFSPDNDSLVDTVKLFYLSSQATRFAHVYISTRQLGVPLAEGSFANVMRHPFEAVGRAGLWVATDGSGANESAGSFQVLTAEFSYGTPQPNIERLLVNFTYIGDVPTNPIIGTLSVNMPATPPQVIELAGEGTDTVRSSISYVLPDNVEILELSGGGATTGMGNGLNNTLAGNDNDNQLDGGAGSDVLVGGGGDDSYIVDVGDTVVEGVGQGADRVLSGVSWTLSANVEDLYLTGAAAIAGTGNALDNRLHGNAGANVLNGGAGNDLLDGGLGRDRAQFSGAKAGHTLSRGVAGLLVAGAEGVDTLRDIEYLGFGAGLSRAPGGASHGDFNGDGRTDVILQNSNGTVSLWQMNNLQIAAGRDYVIPSSWSVVDAKADYNGDGKSDVLLQNLNGTVSLWQMDGVQIAAGRDYVIPSAWRIVDNAGDYNGDGKADIVLQNANGTVSMWQMNGVDIAAGRDYVIPSTWRVVSAHSDFNGDGNSDVILQNDNGTVSLWQMDGTQITASRDYVIPRSWSIVDTQGDFNGDGKSDVLLRNANGAVSIWQMDGLQISANVDYFVPNNWKIIESSGDYNGDGKTDILLRNDNGTVSLWQMNGAAIAAGRDYVIPDRWGVLDAKADYNGDGKSDVLLQNQNGTVSLWQMDGLQIATGRDYVIPAAWNVIDAQADYNGDGRADIALSNDNGTVSLWQMNGPTIASGADYVIPIMWGLV